MNWGFNPQPPGNSNPGYAPDGRLYVKPLMSLHIMGQWVMGQWVNKCEWVT